MLPLILPLSTETPVCSSDTPSFPDLLASPSHVSELQLWETLSLSEFPLPFHPGLPLPLMGSISLLAESLPVPPHSSLYSSLWDRQVRTNVGSGTN